MTTAALRTPSRQARSAPQLLKKMHAGATEKPATRRGRPIGSKNQVKKVASPAKATPARAKSAPGTTLTMDTTLLAKTSKADLITQVLKLTRTVSRLRLQNKALKHQASTED